MSSQFLSRKFKFTISILSQQHKKTQAGQGLRFRCLHNGWRRITPSFPSPSLAAPFLVAHSFSCHHNFPANKNPPPAPQSSAESGMEAQGNGIPPPCDYRFRISLVSSTGSTMVPSLYTRMLPEAISSIRITSPLL